MMALDRLNNLDAWPLDNLGRFIETCVSRGVREVNITGSNTDPLLYRHHENLLAALREGISGVKVGIRTNGALATRKPDVWHLYDKASISITSLNDSVYQKTMGLGSPPNVRAIIEMRPSLPIKVNVVLCPETVESGDVYRTLDGLADAGVKTVNLREPYGQPHIGSPLYNQCGTRLGMPTYDWRGMDVTYWDVHYVEVESVNLYANGIVSETYPITRGHSPDGRVVSQDGFPVSGRHVEQWAK